MKLWLERTILFGVLGAVAAACGGDDNGSSDAAIDQTSDQTSAPDVASVKDATSDTSTNDAGADAPSVQDTGADAPVDVAVDAPEDVVQVDAVVDAPEDVVQIDAGNCVTNTQCATNQFCQKPNADCNGTGTCADKPQFCPQIADPVCGCNKQTYINSCYANVAGENVAYTGACE